MIIRPKIENVPHVEAEMVEEILPSRALKPTPTTYIDEDGETKYIQKAVVIKEIPTVIVQDAKFVKQNPAYVKSVLPVVNVEHVHVPRRVTVRKFELPPPMPAPILDKDLRAQRKKLVVKHGHRSLYAEAKEERRIATKLHQASMPALIWDNFEHVRLIKVNETKYLQIAMAARDGVKYLVIKQLRYAWGIDEVLVECAISVPINHPYYLPMPDLLSTLNDIPMELFNFPIYNEDNMQFMPAKEKKNVNYKDFKLVSRSASFLTAIDSKRERKRDESEEAISTTPVFRWGDNNKRKLLGLDKWQSAYGQHGAGDNGAGN